MGVYLYLAWIVGLIAALVVGITLVVRHGRRGVGRAAAVVLGAILMWGFVAAGVGLLEASRLFSVEILVLGLIGVVGLATVYVGCCPRPRP